MVARESEVAREISSSGDQATTTQEPAKPLVPEWVASGRIPCLDGLRAVSIGLVLFAHQIRSPSSPLYLEYRYTRAAAVGVDVFFVISGFLITLLLLRENDRTGRVSLRAFYYRRALRILPAYFAYLLFIAVLAWVGAVAPSPIEWIGALTYTANFLPEDRTFELGHLWSLSVEEHFYLLWPVTLVLFGTRRALVLLAVVLVVATPLRFALWKLTSMDVKYVTPTRYDAIGYGCLLAFAVRRLATWRFAAWVAPAAGLGVATCTGLLAISQLILCRVSWTYSQVFAPSVAAVLIAAVLFFCLASPRGLAGRLLELRPVAYVGILSYSLYLWQQAFLNHNGGWWCQWPLGLCLAVAAAVTCHYLIERPFLQLKAKAAKS